MDLLLWLESTKAEHVMVRDVVTLDQESILAHGAALLLEEQISGLPVVNNEGACVGILSASDVIGSGERASLEREKIAESSFWSSNLALPSRVYADKLEAVRDKIAPAAEQPVKHFMTADLVSVGEDVRLTTVVQYMVDAHIHRVVVLDEAKRLRGIISTIDVLAAMLRETGKVGVFEE